MNKSTIGMGLLGAVSNKNPLVMKLGQHFLIDRPAKKEAERLEKESRDEGLPDGDPQGGETASFEDDDSAQHSREELSDEYFMKRGPRRETILQQVGALLQTATNLCAKGKGLSKFISQRHVLDPQASSAIPASGRFRDWDLWVWVEHGEPSAERIKEKSTVCVLVWVDYVNEIPCYLIDIGQETKHQGKGTACLVEWFCESVHEAQSNTLASDSCSSPRAPELDTTRLDPTRKLCANDSPSRNIQTDDRTETMRSSAREDGTESAPISQKQVMTAATTALQMFENKEDPIECLAHVDAALNLLDKYESQQSRANDDSSGARARFREVLERTRGFLVEKIDIPDLRDQYCALQTASTARTQSHVSQVATYCASCGHTNPEGSNFCVRCAKPLAANDAAVGGGRHLAAPPPSVIQVQGRATRWPVRRILKWAFGVVGIGILGFVVLIIAVLLFPTGQTGKNVTTAVEAKPVASASEQVNTSSAPSTANPEPIAAAARAAFISKGWLIDIDPAHLETLGQPMTRTCEDIANPHTPQQQDGLCTYTYPGLEVRIYTVRPEQQTPTAHLVQVELNAPSWEVQHGLGVGATVDSVQKTLGDPAKRDGSSWRYEDPLNGVIAVVFSVDGNRVTRIRWESPVD